MDDNGNNCEALSSALECDINRYSQRYKYKKTIQSKSMHMLLVTVLLQFLLTFAQGQGHGQQESFSVNESEDIGTIVGTVRVEENYEYRFIVESPEFNLDSRTGVITTAVVLDRESYNKDTFNLAIQSEPERYFIEVDITVNDVNDNSPVFEHPIIEVEFTETSDSGTQKLLDTATDKDIGDNGVTTTYIIVSGNEQGKFKLEVPVDTLEPLLYLENIDIIDREVKGAYLLNISAQDGGNPVRYGYLLVNITIRDINDNQPLFEESDYFAEVNETVQAGTSIIKMYATDEDINDNGIISYSLLNDEHNQFGIDPQTGIIRTLKKLRCERDCSGPTGCTPKSCVLIVEASDGGKPNPQTGRAYVTITLVDENDHDPVVQFNFLSSGNNLPYATVLEDANINTIVAIVSVSDPDEGPNGQTTAKIIAGNRLSHFLLMNDLIKTNSKLDREKVEKYNLTIEVKDMGVPQRSSTAYLQIVVSDINDHEPVFGQDQYSNDLSEFLPVHSFVASVTATDSDSGINAEISYTIIRGNERNWFTINSNTGLVTTISQLDYEEQSGLTLVIQAQDGGSAPHKSEINLELRIQDENDEIPSFDSNSVTVTITEGQSYFSPIKTLSAVDNDQGRNGTVVYTFSGTEEYYQYFNLDMYTGELRLQGELDRERYSSFILKVKASDQALVPLTSSVSVYVEVNDINDNPPIFYPSNYYVRLPENRAIFSSIVQVLATDADSGVNGNIHYEIRSGSNGKFQIDSLNGWIVVQQTLTRDDMYTLTVLATDSDASNRHTATASVFITVVSIFANMVAFTDFQEKFIIEEDSDLVSNIDIGRIIGTVRVSQNGFSYVIASGDPQGIFRISNNGVIETAKKVNHEEQSVYELQVVATKDKYYGEVTITIEIDDINDFTPSFGYSSVVVDVERNKPIGHSVYLASAKDLDSGNNAILQYTITDNTSDLFSVDTLTGLISVHKSLTSSTLDSVPLTVVATDSGSSPLYSSVRIVINIIDIDNIRPIFEREAYEISVSESTFVNTQLLQVSAFKDSVKFNTFSYKITNSSSFGDFGIFPDGFIYIAKELDRESQDTYLLQVTATNTNLPSVTAKAIVTVHVLDSNDNAPRFTNDSYDMYLRENSDINNYVGIVHTTDEDIGQNAEVIYDLESNNKFDIDSSTGVIVSRKIFDREELLEKNGQDYLTLHIIARDNGDRKRSSQATVFVHITDENDNAPVFVREAYEPLIEENKPIGTEVLRVSATDLDSGKNNMIIYSIVHNVENAFEIDSSTGVIKTTQILDREIQDSYDLTVMASDEGFPSLNSTTLVTITVTDKNDNAPVFVTSISTLDIDETSASGMFLTQFIAEDSDIGNNGAINYILGNDNDPFEIDRSTGMLFLVSTVDFESDRKHYSISIEATDQGQDSLSSSIICRINVLDANDNAPIFNQQPTPHISEDKEPNTSVYNASATDLDSGTNALLKYQIISQSPAINHFAINENTGEIKTQTYLDREDISEYTLIVLVTDQPTDNKLEKSAELTLKILVDDSNDNFPIFQSPTAISVQQGISYKIGTVHAVDADIGLNGQIYYSIKSQTVGDMFSISRTTGDLDILKAMNPATIYTIVVKAEDRSVQNRKNTEQTITVFNLPPSESGPRFIRSYSEDLTENSEIGTSILTVSTDSPGPKFYLTGVRSSRLQNEPNYFEVNPNTGSLSTLHSIDKENMASPLFVDIYALSSNGQARSTEVRLALFLFFLPKVFFMVIA